MKGYPTTFLGLFDDPFGGRPTITEIEIPIIQRDFAQGRGDEETTALRNRFLDRIVQAATTDAQMGLDFVYGDVQGGVLQPLDGQQRLTTLYLLHWYVASCAGVLDANAAWLRFSYATRPTARDFTRTLSENPYARGHQSPSQWVTDQPWFVYPWRQDPTISSMLVMLDAIHDRFDQTVETFDAVWERLTAHHDDVRQSPIWFLFLPVVDMDHGEDLYIKMNSRGKPLTTFEVFKADFESIIKSADPARHAHLVSSIDGSWADVLWEYEKRADTDYKIDEEFERYLTFIIEISEWRDGQPERKWHSEAKRSLWPIEERARLAFADPNNVHASRNRDFFFHAFDTWVGADPSLAFGRLFRAGGAGEGALPLFSATPDLFEACIAKYGTEFSAQETLLLYGCLLARQAGSAIAPHEVAKRLRTLRNLTAAFIDRDRSMSSYVASTEKLILKGSLDHLEGFRADWVADEALKWEFLERHPEVEGAIHQIEDNSLIRGRTMAFDLDAATLPARAEAFTEVSLPGLRDLLGAALLTKGDYSRDVGWKGNRRQLGSSQHEDSWIDMLTTGSRTALVSMREPLMALLDDFSQRSAGSSLNPSEVLEAIALDWLADREARALYDWRYYFVRYPGARSAKGKGYYVGQYSDPGGFSYLKFRMLHGGNYNAYFSDVLLRAAWIDGELVANAEEPSWWHRDDPGLALTQSRIEVRSVDSGFQIVLPTEDADLRARVGTVLEELGADSELRVPIIQRVRGGRAVDAEDRVQLCVRLVSALAAQGL